MVVSKLLEKDVLFDRERLFVHQLYNSSHPENLIQLIIFLLTIKGRESEGERRKYSLLGENISSSKKFPFLRWKKSFDHPSNCPIASWSDLAVNLEINNLFCAFIFTLVNNVSQAQGSDMVVVLFLFVSGGKRIFMSGGCFPAWGASASNYSFRSVSKLLLPWTWSETHKRMNALRARLYTLI